MLESPYANYGHLRTRQLLFILLSSLRPCVPQETAAALSTTPLESLCDLVVNLMLIHIGPLNRRTVADQAGVDALGKTSCPHRHSVEALHS